MDSLRIAETQLQEAIVTTWNALLGRSRDLAGLAVTIIVESCRNAYARC